MTTLNAEQIGGKVVQNGQSTVEEEVINGGGTTTATEGTKKTNLEEATDAETTAVGSAAVGEKDEAKVENGEATEEETVNGAESTDERAFGTKTPPASQQRQTPPQSASIRAPIVRKRCSAVFGTQTSAGGLSALTSAMLGKKPRKQSVLDNAASDWRAFVQEEQLEQELESHMRSKDAYLDKQEFLLRADYSQFERERDLRAQERRVQQQQANSNNKPI